MAVLRFHFSEIVMSIMLTYLERSVLKTNLHVTMCNADGISR